MAQTPDTDMATAFPNLYKKNTLYNAAEPTGSELFTEGNNTKGIVLVYSHPLSKTVGAVEREILTRILNRLNATVEDMALINTDFNAGITYNTLSKTLSPKALVAFDVTPALLKLNIDAPLYAPIYFGKTLLLFCDNLVTIDKNNDLKKRFWAQFAPLFG